MLLDLYFHHNRLPESRRKVYIRRQNKILLFNNAREADDYIDSEKKAQEAIDNAKRLSRKQRKRIVVEVVKPEQEVDVNWLESLIKRFDMPVELPNLLAQQDYDRVMQIYAQAMMMQDEDDIELLLLA